MPPADTAELRTAVFITAWSAGQGRCTRARPTPARPPRSPARTSLQTLVRPSGLGWSPRDGAAPRPRGHGFLPSGPGVPGASAPQSTVLQGRARGAAGGKHQMPGPRAAGLGKPPGLQQSASTPGGAERTKWKTVELVGEAAKQAEQAGGLGAAARRLQRAWGPPRTEHHVGEGPARVSSRVGGGHRRPLQARGSPSISARRGRLQGPGVVRGLPRPRSQAGLRGWVRLGPGPGLRTPGCCCPGSWAPGQGLQSPCPQEGKVPEAARGP